MHTNSSVKIVVILTFVTFVCLILETKELLIFEITILNGTGQIGILVKY